MSIIIITLYCLSIMRAGAVKRGTTPAWLAPEVFRGPAVT